MRRIVVTGTVALALALSACSGGENPTTPTTPPPPAVVVADVSVQEVLDTANQLLGTKYTAKLIKTGETVDCDLGPSGVVKVRGTDSPIFLACYDNNFVVTGATQDEWAYAAAVGIWFQIGATAGYADFGDSAACVGGFIAHTMPGFTTDDTTELKGWLDGYPSSYRNAMVGLNGHLKGAKVSEVCTKAGLQAEG